MANVLICKTSDDSIVQSIPNGSKMTLLQLCNFIGLDSTEHYLVETTDDYTTRKAQATLYIDSGVAEKRNKMPLVIPSDSFEAGSSLSITGVPNNTSVYLDGSLIGVVTDGEVILTSQAVTTMELEFVCYSYKTRKEIIHAT